jgi:hypothetical protein
LFFTILAAPSITTYSSSSTDHGVLVVKIGMSQPCWVLIPLQTTQPALVHCPVLAAQKGTSRLPNLSNQVVPILLNAQPSLMLAEQLIVHSVEIDDTVHMWAFLFPEVCDLPFGLCWPTTMSFSNFADSLKAALGTSHQHFNSILITLLASPIGTLVSGSVSQSGYFPDFW